MTPSVRGEDGSVFAAAWVGLATTCLVLVLVVDLAAYLVAASRAQTVADAAALAAVTVSDPRGRIPGDPTRAAIEVTKASGADLLTCECPDGARQVTVVVEVGVRAIAVTRFAGRSVSATASAVLVPPR